MTLLLHRVYAEIRMFLLWLRLASVLYEIRPVLSTIGTAVLTSMLNAFLAAFPDSMVPGANMGPIWVRQDPGGPTVGPMNFAIWDDYHSYVVDWFQCCISSFFSWVVFIDLPVINANAIYNPYCLQYHTYAVAFKAAIDFNAVCNNYFFKYPAYPGDWPHYRM